MEKQISVTRQERLGRLGDLCQAIAGSLQQAGLGPDQVFITFRRLVSAECGQCGTRVSGDELFVLTQPADGKDLTVSRRRLRLGFCANTNCQSYHCRLTFQPGDKIDWKAWLARADRMVQDQEDSRAGRGKRWRSELIRPTAIAVAALLLILLFWQLYFGGRIPLIREPEQFRVDPYPSGEDHVR